MPHRAHRKYRTLRSGFFSRPPLHRQIHQLAHTFFRPAPRKDCPWRIPIWLYMGRKLVFQHPRERMRRWAWVRSLVPKEKKIHLFRQGISPHAGTHHLDHGAKAEVELASKFRLNFTANPVKPSSLTFFSSSAVQDLGHHDLRMHLQILGGAPRRQPPGFARICIE